MATLQQVALRPRKTRQPLKVPEALSLGKALLIAVILEVMVIVFLVWQHPHTYRIPPVKPRKFTQVQFYRLPPPQHVVHQQPKAPPKIKIPKRVSKPVVPIAHPKPKTKPKPMHHPRRMHHVQPKHHVIRHRHRTVHHHRVIHHVLKPKHTHKPIHHKPVQHEHKVNSVQHTVPTPKPHPTATQIGLYARTLHGLIQKHLIVSSLVKEMGLSGTVRVQFKLRSNGGQAYDIHIISGTEAGPIRQSVLRTIKRLKFPSFPSNFGSGSRTFVVAISINTQ